MMGNVVRSHGTLGDESAIGPLATFQVDPNLLIPGIALLAFAWLWRGTASTVRHYRKRREKRHGIKEEIRRLKKQL